MATVFEEPLPGPISRQTEAQPPEVEETSPATNSIAAISDIPSVWGMDSGRQEWFIPDLIPRKSVTLLTGESGSGKTWLAHAIAGAVAHGSQFIGLQAIQAPVVYLDAENPLAIVRRNLSELAIPETENLKIWGGWNSPAPPGPDDPRFEQFARDTQGLLIWDPLVGFNPGDEQSATQTRLFMGRFRTLANLGATVLVVHHTGKSHSSKEYRGSSDLKAAVDMAYTVEAKESRGRLHRLRLICFKSRFAPRNNFGLEFKSGEGFSLVQSASEHEQRDMTAILSGVIEQNQGITQKGIIELTKAEGLPKNAVLRCLKAGGPWREEKGKGRTLHYYPVQAPRMEEPVELPRAADHAA
jgi:AAA domain